MFKGENYQPGLPIKEIAKAGRKYIKEKYNDYKFSVTSRESMIDQILIRLKSATINIYENDFNKLSARERYYIIYNEKTEDIDVLNKLLKEKYRYLKDEVSEIFDNIENFFNSYRYDDSDAMSDYFDTNFILSIDVDYDFKEICSK